jgi:glycosyltransferase involved in cell wall biosynthesis
MKIAMVVPSRGFYGGIERHAHDLARGLDARGHTLSLIHGDVPGRDEDVFRRPFDSVVPRRRAAEIDADVFYVHRAGSARELDDLEGRPVVVVSHDHDLTCVRSYRYLPVGLDPCHRPPGFACVRHGCVVVRDRRPDTPVPVRLKSPFRLRRDLVSLSKRARIVAVSHYVRTQLLKAGVPAERTHVIHSIPPEDEAPASPRPAEPRLVVAANLLRGKGVDLAIDALGHLPADVTLTIVGDGPSRGELERRARLHSGRVCFEGWVPPAEIGRQYDRASVVVVPSRWPEPFGMVGIEAMRRHRPVVAAGHGGIPEWAGGTRGARTFEPGDPRSLADAVRMLLADEAAGERAFEHARERFPHRRLVDEVEALLERVLREGAA